jgi:hypothetical protein
MRQLKIIENGVNMMPEVNMESKFLIWLDILGFENLAKEVAANSKVSERKVREDL